MFRGQSTMPTVITIGVTMTLAAIGYVFNQVGSVDAKVDTVERQQSQMAERMSVVETESKQYRADITGIKDDLKDIKKALGVK